MNRGAYELQKFFQSQAEVAPRLGIEPSMLSLLLAGKRMPSIETAAAIEREFGVPCRAWAENIWPRQSVMMTTRKPVRPNTQPHEQGNDNMTDTTDLATLGEITGTLDRPKTLDSTDRSGLEGIGPEDIRLPRLAIAQGLSHEITPGDPQFIEHLKLFDMFNDLTQEIYGRGPFTFVPVRRDVRRIEFTPRSQGGGIVDMNVPVNDPRLQWTVEDNVRTPPRATTFVEFVILMLRAGKAPEPIVLSIKGTNKWNRRASDQLTTFIVTRQTAIYSGLYKVDTLTPAKNDKGTFGIPVCRNAGFIPVDTPAGTLLFNYAKKFHESISGKNIVINREPGSDDDAGEGGESAAPTSAASDEM